MKRSSRSSSRTRVSPEGKTPVGTDRWIIVRVYYHSIHSVLPREALKVEMADGRVFGTFEEAAVQARDMRVGGEYSYAPMLLDRPAGGQGACGGS